ncbi:tryptophan synthase beta subunit-like PLP-dependent enzyme [Pseudovirgaria hyperparasitica]|uniref:Tryptophan synthase beta subunit-like PLP-dependent enzyme n=1 Tax=Pseudovirgaria hyperparasitica TaxID=470096 RepID=A0A6A6W6V3_9PEZI|nr:tryptophan synthase beta subunit-like PLP-dependent enzyme [Pseudovirgaria hyperparasitica]KAF2758353.1 tryptophan synthase beta subunit-like PLP-dependent enzyme [Pseudovirgaria hyperparasitica]
MGDISATPPLTRTSVQEAHERIKQYIHLTPVLTSTTLSGFASEPQSQDVLKGTEWEGQQPARPKIRFFFKCENYQKIGAFKARGAFHALSRLTEEELSKGVVTHSSGNHAQALALAARTRGVKAYIVMPTISTPSKISGTKGYGAEVIFSGSTSQEREAVTNDVIARTGAIMVPPYDHPNIMLGQGTMALELESQVDDLIHKEPQLSVTGRSKDKNLDAVITPCGGGGMLSGVATALSGTGTLVFGAEPRFEGGNDAERGLAQGERITSVKTLTIADGLRTPVGKIPWTIISDNNKVRGVYSVTEEQIKAAMKLVMERMKVFIEPSAAVAIAVCLYNEDFRKLVEEEAGPEGWNIGVVFSGGNTTLEAISKLFAVPDKVAERAVGVLGRDGKRIAENVPG